MRRWTLAAAFILLIAGCGPVTAEMIARLQHWWRCLCGESVAAPFEVGGDVMTRAWEW